MPTLASPLDLAKYEARNLRAHQLGAAPSSPVTGQMYYNSGDNTLYWWDGSIWVSARGGASATPQATTSTQGTIQLSGDLAGTATAPLVAALAITDAKVAAANKDGTAGTASMRTLGTGATQAAAGNDARLSDARSPSGTIAGDLAGSTWPTLTIANLAVTLAKMAANSVDSSKIVDGSIAVGDTAAAFTVDALATAHPMAANLAMNSNRITGLMDPSGNADAATKSYVDGLVQGLDLHPSVHLATTANIASMSGNQAIDGVTTLTGFRVLVKNQTTTFQNGIWMAQSGAWLRTTDADVTGDLGPGSFVFVEQGATQADSGWIMTADVPPNLGTDPVPWTQFSGAGQVIPGAGLTKAGNSLDVVAGDTSLTVAADSLVVNTSVIASRAYADAQDLLSPPKTTALTAGAGLTGGGDLSAARTFDVVAGDTSLTVAADSVIVNTAVIAARSYVDSQDATKQNAATAAGYYSALLAGTAAVQTVTKATHGLRASRGLIPQVQEEATGTVVLPDLSVAASGDVTVTFGATVTANAYRLTIVG